MKHLQDLQTYIRNEIEENKLLIPLDDTIEISKYRQREKVISQMTQMADEMQKLLAAMSSTLVQLNNTHAIEKQACETLINPDWVVVTKKKKKKSPEVQPISLGPAFHPRRVVEQVRITDSLSISAIVVQSLDEVQQGLHFCTQSEQFALRIGEMLLYGNIGNIYTNKSNEYAERVKDCHWGQNCEKRETCRYYHDPKTVRWLKDHRNFLASSFIYQPDNKYHTGRVFGSRDSLEADKIRMTKELKDIFMAQIMHDILCYLLH